MPVSDPARTSQNLARLLDRGALIVLCSILLLLAQTTNLIFPAKFQQYRYLAESLLAGRLDFLEITGTSWDDSAAYRGAYYWPLGPLPALIMAPMVWLWRYFGQTFQQGYVNFALIAWTSYLVFRLARKHGQDIDNASWFAVAFIGSSSFLSMAIVPWSWHLAHVVAVWLLLLAIHEYVGRQRWALIGFTVGLVFASRQTAGLAAIGFATMLFSSERHWQRKLSDSVLFALGFGAVLLIVLYYNYFRFNAHFESGYNYQLGWKPDGPLIGFWNLWPNLRVFLFNIPIATDRLPYIVADPFGMSIAIVSPWLLFLRPRKWYCQDTLLAASIATISLAFLLWWSTGSNQLGYRFSLDFMPLLFWLMLRTDALRLTVGVRAIIWVSVLINLYFLTTVFRN
jgi:hypothetical protein